MNWNEYRALAIRTESIPSNSFGMLPPVEVNSMYENAMANERATRLLHAAFGLCTELAELTDGHTIVNFVEEVGDVYWYLAIADDVISWWDYEHGKPANELLGKKGLFWLGEIQDVLKRHIFYGKELDTVRMIIACDAIALHLAEDIKMHNLRTSDAWEANIRKLEKRFPDKMFTQQAAIHRDVDRELDHILESGELIPKVNTLELGEDEDWPKQVCSSTGAVTYVEPEDMGLSKVAIKFAELCNGVQLTEAYVDATQFTPKEAKTMALGRLGVSEDKALEELGFALESCDIKIWSSPETGTMLQVFMKPEAGVQLVEKELDKEEWKCFVSDNLSKAQIERMAMDLVTDRSNYYYSLGADELARAYGALYRTYSSRGDKLEDSTVWTMWNEQGYSLRKSEVRDKLQRWM